jgi:hypothetical protein
VDDLQLPAQGRAILRELARRWSAGLPDARSKLEAIRRRLERDYTYSLHTGRARRGEDPVLAFLTRHRRGHCEYFASAMALLGRALGIPTRVVGGYRVMERNALGDYHVVRERNAHAWVEAWLEGSGWTTLDPTPAAGLARQMPAETPFWGALGDLVAHGASRALAWIAARGVVRLTLVVAAAIALWFAVRSLLRRRKRNRRASRAGSYDPPLPCLTRLQRALASRGFTRAGSEPLERFAARLAHREAAELILAYAAHRYGGRGDAGRLGEAMDALARRLLRGT